VAQDDVMIIDFEGEPLRDIAARRAKTSPLRDVAGMLRSFDYATWSALDRLRTRSGKVEAHVEARALAWRHFSAQNFLNGYWSRATRAGLLPEDMETRRRMLELFLLQKALYEVEYEAANRPAWLRIPLRGLLDLILPRTTGA
jgi:maltose alpha-D-glucosyltransferase/alpha-amylase